MLAEDEREQRKVSSEKTEEARERRRRKRDEDAIFGVPVDVESQNLAYGPGFCYGGYFSAPRSVIHRQPITVYEAMYRQQKYLLEEVDHYIERMWTAVLREEQPILCEE